MLWDFVYFTIAIIFVSGVESLLCSRMADRLAGNKGIPFNPNKELWGQGWVQILVPLLNGFPHTGSRSDRDQYQGWTDFASGRRLQIRTETTPGLCFWRWLETVPMACIGGILMFVAFNMVKPAEVREVWSHGLLHQAMVIYTAVMVAVTDFLIGVFSALVIYTIVAIVIRRFGPPGSLRRTWIWASTPGRDMTNRVRPRLPPIDLQGLKLNNVIA